MWHGSELLFAFYLTEVCGMAPARMAAVLAISLFASGLMDVAVGHFLRTRTPSVHAAASVQLIGAVGAGLAFFLFLGIEWLFGARHLLLAMAIGLAFRLAYAFYDVPQNAVLGLAPGGERLRAGLTSLRFVCSGLASLTIAATAAMLLAPGRQAASFATLGAVVGVLAIGTSALFLWTARMRSTVSAAAARGGAHAGAPARRGGGVALLLGIGFVIGISGAVFMKLEPYFAAYRLDTTVARGALMAAVACGGIASQPCVFWCTARWAPATAFRLCAAILMLGTLGFLALGMDRAAWLPAAGFAIGFGLSGLAMLLWAAVANAAAAASAAPPSARAPTMAFGLLTFSQKTASALGTLALGAMLGGHGIGQAWTTSQDTIVLLMGTIPFGGALVCAMLAPRLLPWARPTACAALAGAPLSQAPAPRARARASQETA